MPPTRRVVGINLAQHLVHSMVPVAIAVAGHTLDGSHATCAQEGVVLHKVMLAGEGCFVTH